MDSNFRKLSYAEYGKKSRNIDTNGIVPEDILLFFKKILKYFVGRLGEPPSYLVGCACGASEIVLPLGSLIDVPVGFMRRSNRRGDDDPRIIAEQFQDLRKGIQGQNVLCVEDYVCTGESLKKIMEKSREFGAVSVYGASINNSRNSDVIDLKTHERKFNYFGLR